MRSPQPVRPVVQPEALVQPVVERVPLVLVERVPQVQALPVVALVERVLAVAAARQPVVPAERVVARPVEPAHPLQVGRPSRVEHPPVHPSQMPRAPRAAFRPEWWTPPARRSPVPEVTEPRSRTPRPMSARVVRRVAVKVPGAAPRAATRYIPRPRMSRRQARLSMPLRLFRRQVTRRFPRQQSSTAAQPRPRRPHRRSLVAKVLHLSPRSVAVKPVVPRVVPVVVAQQAVVRPVVPVVARLVPVAALQAERVEARPVLVEPAVVRPVEPAVPVVWQAVALPEVARFPSELWSKAAGSVPRWNLPWPRPRRRWLYLRSRWLRLPSRSRCPR